MEKSQSLTQINKDGQQTIKVQLAYPNLKGGTWVEDETTSTFVDLQEVLKQRDEARADIAILKARIKRLSDERVETGKRYVDNQKELKNTVSMFESQIAINNEKAMTQWNKLQKAYTEADEARRSLLTEKSTWSGIKAKFEETMKAADEKATNLLQMTLKQQIIINAREEELVERLEAQTEEFRGVLSTRLHDFNNTLMVRDQKFQTKVEKSAKQRRSFKAFCKEVIAKLKGRIFELEETVTHLKATLSAKTQTLVHLELKLENDVESAETLKAAHKAEQQKITAHWSAQFDQMNASHKHTMMKLEAEVKELREKQNQREAAPKWNELVADIKSGTMVPVSANWQSEFEELKAQLAEKSKRIVDLEAQVLGE